MVLDELHRCHIPDRAVRPLLMIIPPPSLNDDLGLLKREKPVLIKHASRNLPLKRGFGNLAHPRPEQLVV